MNLKTIIELGFRLMPKELYADLRGCYPTRPITSLLDLLTRNSSTSQGRIHYYVKKIKWQTINFAWLNRFSDTKFERFYLLIYSFPPPKPGKSALGTTLIYLFKEA